MIRRSWWHVLPVVLALALPSTGAWAAKKLQSEAKPAATVEPAKPGAAPVGNVLEKTVES